jgi:hypothetical protein
MRLADAALLAMRIKARQFRTGAGCAFPVHRVRGASAPVAAGG